MNTLSRTLTGGIMSLLGLILLVVSFLRGVFYLLFYAIPLFILGLIILFNKKEDEIEKIKLKKGGKRK